MRTAGAAILRGGAFKPRTSPHSFQGLGQRGLHILAEVSKITGLPVVTEATDITAIPDVAGVAHILQIGTRNAQNFTLLREAGRTGKPVLLKRGFGCTIDEWLQAAEYVLREGNNQVILCERGIRTFERHTRFTLDLGAVPVVKRLSHLPVIVDPSHAGGHRYLTKPLALAAAAVGADGIMVDVHPEPATARCDGAQALDFSAFDDLMTGLRSVLASLGRHVAQSRGTKSNDWEDTLTGDLHVPEQASWPDNNDHRSAADRRYARGELSQQVPAAGNEESRAHRSPRFGEQRKVSSMAEVAGTAGAANTATVRARLAERGLSLPLPWRLPPDAPIPASLVRVAGGQIFVSGHIPLDDNGTAAGPAGRVGAEVDLPTAQQAAVRALLGILASLDDALGDLGEIAAWCRLTGMVHATGQFADFPAVFNPASQLLLDVFGAEAGAHSRVAVGVAGLPWNMPVEIEAQLLLGARPRPSG